MHLLFTRQTLLHFCLSPSQHEWFKYLVQLLDHMYIPLLDFFLVHRTLSLLAIALFAIEPVIEHLRRIEDLR